MEFSESQIAEFLHKTDQARGDAYDRGYFCGNRLLRQYPDISRKGYMEVAHRSAEKRLKTATRDRHIAGWIAAARLHTFPVPDQFARLDELRALLSDGAALVPLRDLVLIHEALDLCRHLGLDRDWEVFKAMAERLQQAEIAKRKAEQR